MWATSLGASDDDRGAEAPSTLVSAWRTKRSTWERSTSRVAILMVLKSNDRRDVPGGSPSLQRGDDQSHTRFVQIVAIFGRHFRIGDQNVNVAQRAKVGERLQAEFRMVCQHDYLVRLPHDRPLRFHQERVAVEQSFWCDPAHAHKSVLNVNVFEHSHQ